MDMVMVILCGWAVVVGGVKTVAGVILGVQTRGAISVDLRE